MRPGQAKAVVSDPVVWRLYQGPTWRSDELASSVWIESAERLDDRVADQIDQSEEVSFGLGYVNPTLRGRRGL